MGKVKTDIDYILNEYKKYLISCNTAWSWLSKDYTADCTNGRKNTNRARPRLRKGHNFFCNVLQTREAY